MEIVTSGLCAGDLDDEPSSVPFLARSGDMSVVGVNQFLDDGQANSTPGGVADSGSPPKSIEDVT